MRVPDADQPKAVIKMAPPEPLDDFWLTTIRTTAQGSVAALEDAAKQLVTITSFSQTLYFAAISFSDLKKALPLIPSDVRCIYIPALIAPIIFWAVSLWYAVAVFKPNRYPINLESPDQARETYNSMVSVKHEALKASHVYLTIGFVALIVAIVIYLVAIPVVPGK